MPGTAAIMRRILRNSGRVKAGAKLDSRCPVGLICDLNDGLPTRSRLPIQISAVGSPATVCRVTSKVKQLRRTEWLAKQEHTQFLKHRKGISYYACWIKRHPRLLPIS